MVRPFRSARLPVLVGVAALFAASCGSSDGPPAGDPSGGGTGAQTGAITAIGEPAVSGCQLTAAFDLVATSPIGFLGIQEVAQDAATANASSTLAQRAEVALFQVDSSGAWTQVTESATAASASLNLLLGIVTNSADLTHTQTTSTTDTERHAALGTSSTTDISQNASHSLSKNETADTTAWTGEVAAGQMNAFGAGRSGRLDGAAAANAAQQGTAAADQANVANTAQGANQATSAASNGEQGSVAQSSAPLVQSSWWERGDAMSSGDALAWDSLGHLASSHYVLQVKLNAIAANEAVRVFEGWGTTLFASKVFGASFAGAGCAP